MAQQNKSQPKAKTGLARCLELASGHKGLVFLSGVLAALAFCRKRCFLNISLRSGCGGTVTFSFSVSFDADWALTCKVRFFRFSCIARNLR